MRKVLPAAHLHGNGSGCRVHLISIGTTKNIYHKGWIDFNKNGKMDVFEDPSQTIDKRVTDLLSQMTVDEKT